MDMSYPPILLYSKYSNSCNSLMNTLKPQVINAIGLQTLCIDNKEIRESIQNNNTYSISVVPCLLVYVNGAVEKYEGQRVFMWFKEILAQMSPPAPPQPPQPQEPPQQSQQQSRQDLLTEQEKLRPRQQKPRKKPQPKPHPRPPQHLPEPEEEHVPLPPHVPDRMRPVGEEQPTGSVNAPVTDLSMLGDEAQFDDDYVHEPPEEEPEGEEQNESMERYRNPVPPKRIPVNNSGFIEDENLFGGEAASSRQPPAGVITQNYRRNPESLLEKAKNLARGRNEIESNVRPVGDAPDARRP